MKSIKVFLIMFIALFANAASDSVSLHKFTVERLRGKDLPLNQFKDKVVLVVNTASKCGYTPQYEGLEKLYKQKKDDGLVILGVPSNDFGQQEPGSSKEIARFCKINYGVSFPITAKTVVKGPKKSELYEFLTASNPKLKGEIKWNFEKILVNKEGRVVARFESAVKPSDPKLVKRIEAELK
jgi:glutathione peroxidase